MHIDLNQIKLVAGTFVAVVGAVTLAWTFQPFALAEDMRQAEVRLAASLEDAIQSTQRLASENAYIISKALAEHVLSPAQQAIELQIIEVELDDTMPPEKKARYLHLLKQKQRAINGELTTHQNRARSLAPVFAAPPQ